MLGVEVLIPARRLVARLRGPASAAGEAAAVRARLRSFPRRRRQVSAEEHRLAGEMRRLKVELSRLLAGVETCSSCARGFPPPAGSFHGGNCCSGDTLDIFDDDELAALALAGTAPRRLRAAPGPHAGCAFRGERGCSLSPAERPILCVRYVCKELARELHARGDLDRVEALAAELGAAFEAFAAAREAHGADCMLRSK